MSEKQENLENVESKNKKDSKKAKVKTESLNFKCEQFFGKNWKFIGGFLAIAVLVMAYEISNISSRMEVLENVVRENNTKVVLTTTDGRAIKVTKEPLKAEYLKQFAISTFLNNFIVSRSVLTNNFEKPNFKDYSEVLDNVPSLRFILREFIDSKNIPEQNIEINAQAVGDLRAYVQWLVSAVAQDKLPEYISIRDYSLDKYEYKGNAFSIELSIAVVAQSYILSQNEYRSQQGTFKISADGDFDLTKSSDANPYGMRITRLRINPIIKNTQGI